VILELMSPGVEIGLVTTNLDAMVQFYEDFLGLPLQGEIAFADGSQRRYTLGGSVGKLVTYTSPPVLPGTR
jgi:catechol 2,3-dioxygenase-like lactoylglutathione lyase family enzyme